MSIFALFLGGLGLFLTGVAALTQATRMLVGPRLRRLITQGVRTPWGGAVAGLIAGGVTQSNLAVTAAAGGLVSGGTMTLRQSLPLLSWVNIGTTGVALLATVDLYTASLILIGIGGALPFFRIDWRGRLATTYALFLAMGMQLLGASMLKLSMGQLASAPGLAELLLSSGALVLLWLVGFVAAFVAASAAASGVLAIALATSGTLDLSHAALVIYGGCAGSGLAQIIAGSGTDVHGRRTALYQGFWKIGGSMLLVALWILEEAGLPGLITLCRTLFEGVPGQIGALLILYQTLIALAAWPLDARAERWLLHAVPEPAETELGRPRHLADAALPDPPSALALARLEEARLIEYLPLFLDSVREHADAPPPKGLDAAAIALEAAIDDYLRRLQAMAPESIEAAARLRGRLATLTALREAAIQLAAFTKGASGPVEAPLATLVEALHLLLSEAQDLMPELLHDRTAAMDGLRARWAMAGLDGASYQRLFSATDAYARAVWLLGRLS
jgi:phosphate:Na+ symporter